MSKYLDAAFAVLQDAGEPLTAREIVKKALKMGHVTTKGSTPTNTMAGMLYTDTARKHSRFTKHGPGLFKLSGTGAPRQGKARRGGKGGGKRAAAATDRTIAEHDGQAARAVSLDACQDTKEIDGSHGKDYSIRIGAAGEFRVMSELLLRGYNADRITIDSGIDIRATKDNSVYEIQVKTATEMKAGKKFVTTIREEAFRRVGGPNVYYIFVLRNRYNGIRYVIVTNKEMRDQIKNGNITKNKAGYQVQFSVKDGSVFLRKKNVDDRVNDWDL